MNPRLEVFCSIDPEDGREFVAVMTWHRMTKEGDAVPISHANFYASSAREAKAKAEGWVEREQAKLADQKAAAEQRVAERTKRRQEAA